MSKAYYNEFDKYAAQWLRNLIVAGHIAPGDVDERSIEDVKPSELARYTQCHFFAGVGVWSYALRRAGWPDDRPVWTGSCPCQPFSTAGQGAGFSDERHLWPAFHYLISQRRPVRIYGEQVSSKDADAWVDLVHTDMEALDYAFGAVPFPSAGIGAPHIRDRLYWMGHTNDPRLEGFGSGHQTEGGRFGEVRPIADAGSVLSGLADTQQHSGGRQAEASDNWQPEADRPANRIGLRSGTPSNPSPTNGHWRDADWLFCRDGKWRPVEPGTFPLAHGASARVGRLRAYGNAINAEAAIAFIEATM